MPVFEFEKQGKTLEFDAPDQETAIKAFSQQTATPGLGGTLLDVGKSFAGGVAKGVESFPGAAASMIGAAGRAVEPALEAVGIGDPAEREKREKFRAENPQHFYTSALPKPKTTAGKFAESVGEFVPAVAAGPGGVVSRGVAAVGGGVGSEAAGELAGEGTDAEPYARMIGGVVGAMAPSIGARAITPLPATPRHRANVATLEQEGVTGLTAGERTGYRPLRYAEEHLGGAPLAGRAAEEALDQPREQFTRAALRRVGEDADRATPEVIDRAHRRIGTQFDTLSARNNAQYDQPFANEVFQAQHDYDFLFADPARRPIVQNEVDHIVNKIAQSPTLTGEEYKAMRSRLSRSARGHRADPELHAFLLSLQDAMDNLMERSIRANNPADLGAWQATRNQYRNLLAIDKATTGVETGGIITPAKLKQSVVAQNRTAYARGQGDFGELARAGENVMPGLPQSGTAPRRLTEAGPLKLATTGASGRALMSSPLQSYLGNQIMTDILPTLPPAQAAVIRSFIANTVPRGPLEQQSPLSP